MIKLGAVAPIPVSTVTGLPELRAAICETLRGVDGLSVTEVPPVTPTAYSAWPQWASTSYAARAGNSAGQLSRLGSSEFDVLVTLPAADQAEITRAGDELLPRLIAALWQLGPVTSAQPAQVQFDQGQAMPALRVRLIPRPT